MSNLWYPKYMPIQGLTGLGGGATGLALAGGATAAVGSVYFDGNGDTLRVASADLPRGSESRQVEFFTKIDSNYSSWTNIFSYGTSSVGKCFGVNIDNSPSGEWAFTGYGGGDWNSGISVAGYCNVWIHVCVTYNGSSVQLFLNGVSQGTSSESLNTDGTSFPIGGSEHTGFGENFKGKVSNFRMLDNVLYTSGFTVPTAELTATSQSASGCVLLCCQNSNDVTDAAVAPGSLTAYGDTTGSTDSPFATGGALLYGYNNADNGFDSSNSSRSYNAWETGDTVYSEYSGSNTSNVGGQGANSAHIYRTPFQSQNITWNIETTISKRYIWKSTDGVNWTSKGSYYDTNVSGGADVSGCSWIAMAGGSNSCSATVTSKTAGYTPAN
tara:strand:- start:484 stop:1632 length:1149 start_codon:yes stop_codon:yes gene_type:complete